MINYDLIYQIFKLRHGDPQYCFPLNMFLGDNGLYPNHPYKDKTFIRNKNGEKYIVDDVYVHWHHGWYFVALARDKNNSHTSITWNINSEFNFDFSINKFTLQP